MRLKAAMGDSLGGAGVASLARTDYIFRTAMDRIISPTYRQVYRTTQETMPGARPIDRRA